MQVIELAFEKVYFNMKTKVIKVPKIGQDIITIYSTSSAT